MQKKLTAAAIAGAVVLGGGAAIAVPAFADSSSSSGSSTDTKATSRIDAIKQALKGLVDNKTITQDQADKVAEALGQPGALPGGGFGHHGFGGRGMIGLMQAQAEAAAKVLGMSAEDIRSALREGTTLAELAKKQGKSETTLINALVDAAKTQLAAAVKDGKLTQAQADAIEKNLPEQVKRIVENGRGGFGPGLGLRGPGRFGKGERGGRPASPSPSASGSTTNWAPSSPTI
jgi:hypothetical protein